MAPLFLVLSVEGILGASRTPWPEERRHGLSETLRNQGAFPVYENGTIVRVFVPRTGCYALLRMALTTFRVGFWTDGPHNCATQIVNQLVEKAAPHMRDRLEFVISQDALWERIRQTAHQLDLPFPRKEEEPGSPANRKWSQWMHLHGQKWDDVMREHVGPDACSKSLRYLLRHQKWKRVGLERMLAIDTQPAHYRDTPDNVLLIPHFVEAMWDVDNYLPVLENLLRTHYAHAPDVRRVHRGHWVASVLWNMGMGALQDESYHSYETRVQTAVHAREAATTQLFVNVYRAAGLPLPI